MSFTFALLRQRHLPSAPGRSPTARPTTDGIIMVRRVWESLRWWWRTGSLRQPEPGTLRAGQQPAAPTSVSMTAVLGGRSYRR
jgi:hypothetical protein